MSAVLAVDPGKTSGWASWVNDELQVGESPFLEMGNLAMQWLHQNDGIIVAESFIINAATVRKSQAPWSLEVIGVLRYVCVRRGLPLVLQTPADAKRFTSDDVLKRLGWYTPGKGHANDTARHLVLYLARSRDLDLSVLLPPANRLQ